MLIACTYLQSLFVHLSPCTLNLHGNSDFCLSVRSFGGTFLAATASSVRYFVLKLSGKGTLAARSDEPLGSPFFLGPLGLAPGAAAAGAACEDPPPEPLNPSPIPLVSTRSLFFDSVTPAAAAVSAIAFRAACWTC